MGDQLVTKKEGCVLEYLTHSSDHCRAILERLCEGFVEANRVILPELPSTPIRYEQPRLHDRKRQTVALANQVANRGRATCIEWACIMVAFKRMEGVDCAVKIVDTYDTDGRKVPYNFHAALEYADGSIEDVTADLDGAPAVGKWYEAAGACCEDCALGHECEGGDDHSHDDGQRTGAKPKPKPSKLMGIIWSDRPAGPGGFAARGWGRREPGGVRRR